MIQEITQRQETYFPLVDNLVLDNLEFHDHVTISAADIFNALG